MSPDNKRHGLDDSGVHYMKYFFCKAPESRSWYRRQDDVQFSTAIDGRGQERAELRLRVLCSLPPRHQKYVFGELHQMCRNFLRRQRVPLSEMTPEELLSEIWQKLLGTVSVHDEERPGLSFLDPNQANVDADTPERDGRVAWLMDQIGGAEAMAHRREDILRRRFGRTAAGSGRRLVQPLNEDDFTGVVSDADAPSALEAADGLRIWRGLLAMADLQFRQHDDASMLLRLLAENPGILQDSTGGQWPITELVTRLNSRFPPPSWTSDRVDNAKKRLMNWIKRLKHNNGFDDVDLEALFARVARQLERNSLVPPTGLQNRLSPRNR
jgi:hypothetical protein